MVVPFLSGLFTSQTVFMAPQKKMRETNFSTLIRRLSSAAREAGKPPGAAGGGQQAGAAPGARRGGGAV